MKLGPKTKAFFASQKKATQDTSPPEVNAANIVELRELTKALFRDWAGPLPDGVSNADFENYEFDLPSGDRVKAKIFTPATYDAASSITVIFFQGNGFLFDMLEAHLPGYARMANAAHCKVIGIDTPLAPEYSAQSINDLSYAVVQYIFNHPAELDVNQDNIVLAGYSGGGNIVANIVNKARFDNSINIKHQILLSPSLDLSLETRNDSPYANYQAMDESSSIEQVQQIVQLYYKDKDPKSSLISPMFEEDLSGVPPTTIVLAEFDAARGDGQAYAEKLLESGVPVEIIICAGQTHNYFIARAVMDDPPDPALVMAGIIKEI